MEKEKVKLDVAENSIEIKTNDDKKYYKMIDLESTVDPNSAKASYKNGVLTVELEKKEKRMGKEVKIEQLKGLKKSMQKGAALQIIRFFLHFNNE